MSQMKSGVLALTLFSNAVSAQVPADLALVDHCAGCPNLSSPLLIRHAGDGSSRLFVVEQGGRIVVLPTGAVSFLATPFLNFDPTQSGVAPPGGFTSGGERGLLGLDFHPNFESNRLVFINYTDGGGHTVVASYQTSATNPDQIDTSTRREILRIKQDFSNHNGGNILFGPDGFLYIGTGDGGSGNDPCNRGQTLTPADLAANNSNNASCAIGAFTGNANSRALLGKILRIDVNNTTPAGSNELCAANADGSANYAIPGSAQSAAVEANPFLGTNIVAGACDEILDYGIRNPWRFSFDRVTGDLFVADVGQVAREEVSLRPATRSKSNPINFGWDCREGFIAAGGTCRGGDVTSNPVLDYPRNAGSSITGGYVYRGPIPGLVGTYMFADFVTSRIWFSTQTGIGAWGPQPTSTNNWGTAASNVSSFGEDEVGNVFVLGYGNGRIYRFNSATSNLGTIFANGFEPTTAQVSIGENVGAE